MEQVLKFALCTILVVSGLQLLLTAGGKPLSTGAADLDDEDYNETCCENQTNPVVECQCNETNLTMMVDGHFLCHWRAVNGRHSISSLTKAVALALPIFHRTQVCTILYF